MKTAAANDLKAIARNGEATQGLLRRNGIIVQSDTELLGGRLHGHEPVEKQIGRMWRGFWVFQDGAF